MTRYDREAFSKAAADILRWRTEVILSPLCDQTTKENALDQIFGQRHTDHGMRVDPVAMADAMAAALLRMPLGPKREQSALRYISRHLGDMPAEKAAEAAFIAARHVQYMPWIMGKIAVRQNPSAEECERRRDLERNTTAEWARQMDRLTPDVWDAKMREFVGAIPACTALECTAGQLRRPELAVPERHTPTRAVRTQNLIAA